MIPYITPDMIPYITPDMIPELTNPKLFVDRSLQKTWTYRLKTGNRYVMLRQNYLMEELLAVQSKDIL